MYEEIPKDFVTVVRQNSNTMRFRLSCQADDRIKGYGEIRIFISKMFYSRNKFDTYAGKSFESLKFFYCIP